MMTLSNIYRIDFEEAYGKDTIPRTVIFNITQISEQEVREAINNDTWNWNPRIVELRPVQIKYLEDKED